mgnify:CR=1 FL=1
MFRMLTCFNLNPENGIAEFQDVLDQFTARLKERNLLESTGAIGQRQRDTIMDTDDERDHEYFFLMDFRNREQCDRSVDFLYRPSDDIDAPHFLLQSMIIDPVFICWQDIGAAKDRERP